MDAQDRQDKITTRKNGPRTLLVNISGGVYFREKKGGEVFVPEGVGSFLQQGGGGSARL